MDAVFIKIYQALPRGKKYSQLLHSFIAHRMNRLEEAGERLHGFADLVFAKKGKRAPPVNTN